MNKDAWSRHSIEGDSGLIEGWDDISGEGWNDISGEGWDE